MSPQASATGAADQGVTDLVRDGHTWWVVEPRGNRRQEVVYTAAPLKRVEHPLMRWVGEVEEVRMKERRRYTRRPFYGRWSRKWIGVRRQRKWRTSGNGSGWLWGWWPTAKGGEQQRWIVPARREEEHRKEAFERARRLLEGERKQCLEVEEDPKGERPSKWRGLRRGRGGQMRFIVGDGDDVGEQEEGEQGQAREEEGREPGQEASGREEREEDGEGVEEGAAEEGGQENAARDRVDEQNRGGGTGEGREGEDSKRRREEDEQERQERQQQEEDEEGRPRRMRARGVRYGEQQKGREEQGAVREGVMVYGPHKVRGRWRRYVGTVEEMIEQQDRTGHVTRAAIMQWEDQGEGDEERLPYPLERLQVCRQGREMEIHGQLVPEQEARELEGEEVSTGKKEEEAKVTINEVEGGREDEEKHRAKAERKEQWGRKMPG